jgi:hypothetical protein
MAVPSDVLRVTEDGPEMSPVRIIDMTASVESDDTLKPALERAKVVGPVRVTGIGAGSEAGARRFPSTSRTVVIWSDSPAVVETVPLRLRVVDVDPAGTGWIRMADNRVADAESNCQFGPAPVSSRNPAGISHSMRMGLLIDVDPPFWMLSAIDPDLPASNAMPEAFTRRAEELPASRVTVVRALHSPFWRDRSFKVFCPSGIGI